MDLPLLPALPAGAMTKHLLSLVTMLLAVVGFAAFHRAPLEPTTAPHPAWVDMEVGYSARLLSPTDGAVELYVHAWDLSEVLRVEDAGGTRAFRERSSEVGVGVYVPLLAGDLASKAGLSLTIVGPASGEAPSIEVYLPPTYLLERGNSRRAG